MVTSASVPLSQEKFHESYYYLKYQLTRGLAPGLGLMILVYFIPYHFWRKTGWLMMVMSLIILIALFVPGLGTSHGGAKRWLDLGLFSFQPSEIVKLSFIIYLAAWLDAKRQGLKKIAAGFLPFALLMGILSILILAQPDIGTFGVIALTAMTMYFLGGAPLYFFPIIAASGATLFFALIKTVPHAASRLKVFLDPRSDPQGVGYQINQALLALGAGGLLGRGLGQGLQKFKYLPQAASDSILAVIGEELGFMGILFLFILFGLLISRGFRIAQRASDNFGRLLAGGLTSWLTIQILINVAAISGLIPLTGITLPFVSLGGSSLAVCLAGAGIVLNISKYSKI